MITRVTGQTLAADAQRNLQTSAGRMSELQQRATSLQKIERASDDPGAAAQALKIRGEQRAVEQYERNVDNGNGWFATVDSALGLTTELLGRAKDLTLQGSNGSMSTEARNAIAVEIEGLRQDLMGQANSKYLGRSVFAGNSDAGQAFAADATFTGAPGSIVERRVGEHEVIRVDADGAAIYGTGDDSVFALLDRVAADLRSGGVVSAHLNDLDTRLQTVIGAHSEVGARHARLLRAEETILNRSTALENQRAKVEDVDLAEAALDLKAQSVNYEAALAITARVLQPTLMDFIR